jgi:hypothetical protein
MLQESFQNEARSVSLVTVELGRSAWRILVEANHVC